MGKKNEPNKRKDIKLLVNLSAVGYLKKWDQNLKEDEGS
jgi:hypothetical protein